MFRDIACGAYLPPEKAGPPLSSVALRVSAIDYVAQWKRCSLTADFLAGYVAPAFEAEREARDQLSVIIDELIENAVKFCADVRDTVLVTVRNYGESVHVEASNTCDPVRAEDLRRSIARMAECDPELLFVEQIEHSAATDPMESRLGLITLRVTHNARLGARIVEALGGTYRVTVQVSLPTQEVSP